MGLLTVLGLGSVVLGFGVHRFVFFKLLRVWGFHGFGFGGFWISGFGFWVWASSVWVFWVSSFWVSGG